ncbi:GNAT family N-acetyltransferase [Alkaliflexus imshenetskii]|uniref:GNAT family N-acetyltransferase n=1 Tax=Alkaliflexus imshenetskii TaxID=286730 RepID=UPI000479DE9F|nr:GNAT family protein [Alkaliflexus imshenetskii]
MIKNDSVALRALEPGDVDILYHWENDMSLWYVSNTLTPFSKHQLEKYVKAAALDIYQTKQLRLIVEEITSGAPKPVGLIDLFDFDPFHQRAGIGIMINQAWRGRGIAASALSLFVQYVFENLALHQLYCNISSHNEASLKLFRSAGFHLIGVKKEWLKTKDGREDECMFQLINPRGR